MAINLAKRLAWTILVSKGLSFDDCRQNMRGFYSRSRPVNDVEMRQEVKNLPTIADMLYDHTLIHKFENKFTSWIQQNSLNKCKGLENLQPDISQGATQAFDSFYINHSDKNIKMFIGEYLYHVVVRKNLNKPFSFIKTLKDIKSGDALILSVPFCDTGNHVPNLDAILQECEDKNVPVLLDCAYYTIAKGLDIDLRYNCIDTVTFSLSKTFPIAHARVGIRYTKHSLQDGQKLHSNINYDNRISAGIGLHFINKFPSDYIWLKYKSSYDKFVKVLGLKHSQTILFADGDDQWIEYGRRDILKSYGLDDDQSLYHNRICVTELLENVELTEKVIDAIN